MCNQLQGVGKYKQLLINTTNARRGKWKSTVNVQQAKHGKTSNQLQNTGNMLSKAKNGKRLRGGKQGKMYRSRGSDKERENA